jgi:hypothetical protein
VRHYIKVSSGASVRSLPVIPRRALLGREMRGRRVLVRGPPDVSGEASRYQMVKIRRLTVLHSISQIECGSVWTPNRTISVWTTHNSSSEHHPRDLIVQYGPTFLPRSDFNTNLYDLDILYNPLRHIITYIGYDRNSKPTKPPINQKLNRNRT